MTNTFSGSGRVLGSLTLVATLCALLASPVHGQTSTPTPSAKQATTKKKAPAPKKPAPASKSTKAPAKVPAKSAEDPKPPVAPVPAAAAAAATVAPAARQQEADYIVAIVNSEPVTNNEVRVRMARAERQLAERRVPAPPRDELRKEILERLISERAQLQYAREQGIKVDDAALEQAQLAIARQNQLPTIEELHKRVQQEGISLKDFRDDVRNQVLLARLREREIEPKLRITETDVDAFIREQTGAKPGNMDVNLAMILVSVPENADAAEQARLEARAKDVAQRARAGGDFAKLAEEFSDANNRGRDGGELGLRPTDRYPELFVQSTNRLRTGEIAGPVKSAAGWHILKVLERKQGDLPEVRIPQTQVRHILLRVTPSQSEQVAIERLADFKRRIQSGQANFESLAREYSQDASGPEGGELGWASPGQFVPEFEQAMNNLDAGQISNPVVSRFGVHLIKVEGRREQALTATEQRQLARNMLRERKAQEAFETWASEVRGRAYVEYRDAPR